MRKFPSGKIDWILKKQKIWFSFTLDRLFINNFFDGMIVSNNYFHPSIFFQENINKRKSFPSNYLCKYPEAWLLNIWFSFNWIISNHGYESFLKQGDILNHIQIIQLYFTHPSIYESRFWPFEKLQFEPDKTETYFFLGKIWDEK